MKFRHLAFALALITAVSSCQKEVDFPPGQNPNNPNNPNNPGNPSSQSIIGNYDFVNSTAHTEATIIVNDPLGQMKSVTISDYLTRDNVGTCAITATQIIGTDIGYSIDTLMYAKTWVNGILISDISSPFATTVPPTSSTSNYVQIGTDSLTVTGSFGSAQGPTGTPPVTSLGYKYSWSGDTLIIRTSVDVTQPFTQAGVVGTIRSKANSITRMKKKP